MKVDVVECYVSCSVVGGGDVESKRERDGEC